MSTFVAINTSECDQDSPRTGCDQVTPAGTSIEERKLERDRYCYEYMFQATTGDEPIAARLYAAIGVGDTTIRLTAEGYVRTYSTSYFPTSGYVQIDSEIISYTGKTNGVAIDEGTLTGCTRGALGTTPAAHTAETDVSLYYPPHTAKIPPAAFKTYYPGAPASNTWNVCGDSIVNKGFVVSQIHRHAADLAWDYENAGAGPTGTIDVQLNPAGVPYTIADGVFFFSCGIANRSSFPSSTVEVDSVVDHNNNVFARVTVTNVTPVGATVEVEGTAFVWRVS